MFRNKRIWALLIVALLVSVSVPTPNVMAYQSEPPQKIPNHVLYPTGITESVAIEILGVVNFINATTIHIEETQNIMDLKLDFILENLGDIMDNMGNVTPAIHGPDKHTDRNHTIFVSGTTFVEAGSQDMGYLAGYSGPKLPQSVDTIVQAMFNVPSGENFLFTSGRSLYIGLKNMGATSGDVNIRVRVLGANDGDTASTQIGVTASPTVITMGAYQFKKSLVIWDLDMSTSYDSYAVEILRSGSSGTDTLLEDLVPTGVYIVMECDQ